MLYAACALSARTSCDPDSSRLPSAKALRFPYAPADTIPPIADGHSVRTALSRAAIVSLTPDGGSRWENASTQSLVGRVHQTSGAQAVLSIDVQFSCSSFLLRPISTHIVTVQGVAVCRFLYLALLAYCRSLPQSHHLYIPSIYNDVGHEYQHAHRRWRPVNRQQRQLHATGAGTHPSLPILPVVLRERSFLPQDSRRYGCAP